MPPVWRSVGKRRVATGEQFPGVGLVPDIPENLVGGRIELVQEGDGQFDDTERRTDVAAGDGRRNR